MPAQLMSWGILKPTEGDTDDCEAKTGDTSILQTKENHSPNKSFPISLCPLHLLCTVAQKQS